MLLTRRTVLVAAMAVCVLPAEGFAGGGGGTKRNATLTVSNETSLPVGFTTNIDSSAIQTAITNGSLAEFEAAGGVLLNPGASRRFSLQAGTYLVGAVDFTTSVPANLTASEITQTVILSRGEPVHLFVLATGAATGGATIKFSFAP